jgi:hypothetical protein
MAPIESSFVTLLAGVEVEVVLEAYQWLVVKEVYQRLVEVEAHQPLVVLEGEAQQLVEVCLLVVYPLAATQSTMASLLLKCSAKLVKLLVANRIRLLVGIRGQSVLHFIFQRQV